MMIIKSIIKKKIESLLIEKNTIMKYDNNKLALNEKFYGGTLIYTMNKLGIKVIDFKIEICRALLKP